MVTVENLSTSRVIMVKKEENYYLDYGDILKNSPTRVSLQLSNQISEIENLEIQVGCGCTIPTKQENELGFVIGIEYDSSRIGSFSKNIFITYTSNKRVEKLKIIIKGKVNEIRL